MSVVQHATSVLFEPPTAALKFLPEGPYPFGNDQLSWVGIQHGEDAKVGSLNILDLATTTNQSHELPGRPGFAFPTTRENTFVIGMERELGLFDISNGEWQILAGDIDSNVENTIINDGVVFEGGIIFGAKDLKFKEKKAGLYLWRTSDQKLVQLRDDQLCSNGKVVLGQGNELRLIDIDSPTQTIVAYDLNVAAGTLGTPRVIVDLTDSKVFPDGMVATPDLKSVIVAIYNPNDAEHGEARQYCIQSGELQAVWRTEAAPQVTCPQLVRHGGKVRVILTTAVEHMTADRLAKYPALGSIFIGETPFDALSPTPIANV